MGWSKGLFRFVHRWYRKIGQTFLPILYFTTMLRNVWSAWDAIFSLGCFFVRCHSLREGSQRSVLQASSLNFFNNNFLAKLNKSLYNTQIEFLQTSLMEYQKNLCNIIEVKKKRHPKVSKFAFMLVSNYSN